VLATLAAGFGMAAYAFVYSGMVGFGAACAGGLAGIYVGALTAGTAGILVGAWIGLLLGFLIGRLRRYRRSRRIDIRRKRGLSPYPQGDRSLFPRDFEEREP
jgi:hypothetical protein